MSSLVLVDVGDDGPMDNYGPRSGGPVRRRSFTPAQKLEFLVQYELACEHKGGGAFLREQGLYSSQITEWRRLRDVGVLQGKKSGEVIGKLSAEQEQIARLRRQLEVSEGKLQRSEAALAVMGKLHEFLEVLSKDPSEKPRKRR